MQQSNQRRKVKLNSRSKPLLFSPAGHIGNVLIVVLIILSIAEVVAQIIQTAIPDPRFKQFAHASEGSLDDSNVQFLWIVLVVNVCIVFAGLASTVLIVATAYRKDRRPLFMATLLKLAEVAACLVNVADPTVLSTTLFVIVVAIIGVELVIACILLLMITKLMFVMKPPLERYTAHSLAAGPGGLDTLGKQFDRLEEWNVIQQVRTFYRKQLTQAQAVFVITSLAILALSLGTFGFELKKIFMTQDEFFTTSVLHEMDNVTHWPERVQNDGIRVLLVILDGLRLDYVTLNPTLQALKNDPDFIKDSKFLESYNEIPTMSVPNWLTFITGSPPELTGVLGNLMVPETHFDSMYKEAKRYGLDRGMTASPWMADLVSSMLPLLHGDGTIPTDYASTDTTVATGDPADWVRSDIAAEGLDNKYDLFLAHFSDIDIQGHGYAVKYPEYNKHNTYYNAVTNKTLIVRKLLEHADDKTVVIITSDHGQVDRGGHGGLGDELRHVPMWVYRKDSGLGSMTYEGPIYKHPGLPAPTQGGARSVRNVDVAPTFCALLGLPVPRQTVGSFIPELMVFFNQSRVTDHWRDLYLERRLLTQAFISKTSTNDLRTGTGDAAYLEASWEHAANRTSKDYIDALEGLATVYANARYQSYHEQIVRNICCTVAIDLVILVVLLYLLQNHTFCNWLSIFMRLNEQAEINKLEAMFAKMLEKHRERLRPSSSQLAMSISKTPTQPAKMEAPVTAEEAVLKARAEEAIKVLESPARREQTVRLAKLRLEMMRAQRWYNGGAVLYSFLVVVIYFAVVVGVFVGLYWLYGYRTWDSTMVHTPEVLPTYLVYSMLPGLIVAIVVTRIYHMFASRPAFPPHATKCQKFWYSIFWAITGLRSRSMNLGLVYLIKCYTMVWVLIALLAFFIAMSIFTFIVPLVFRIHLIDEVEWGYRFRVITAIFMAVPLILVNTAALFYWPSFHAYGNEFDRVFLTKITKRVIANPETMLYFQEYHLLNVRARDYPSYETASDLFNFRSSSAEDTEFVSTAAPAAAQTTDPLDPLRLITSLANTQKATVPHGTVTGGLAQAAQLAEIVPTVGVTASAVPAPGLAHPLYPNVNRAASVGTLTPSMQVP